MVKKDAAYRFKRKPVVTAEGIVSADLATVSDSTNLERRQDLIDDLTFLGYTKLKPVRGEWKGIPEIAFKVSRISEDNLKHIAQRYGQEAVIWGGSMRMIRGSVQKNRPIKFGEDYHPVDGMSLEDVVCHWQHHGDKIPDEDMPVYFSADELVPYKNYRMAGENLSKSSTQSPMWLLRIGRNGISKIETTGRMAITKEINSRKIPVWIKFQDRVTI